ncbi:hypothetical protein QQ045_021309 [Rhodiola kirilowii]
MTPLVIWQLQFFFTSSQMIFLVSSVLVQRLNQKMVTDAMEGTGVSTTNQNEKFTNHSMMSSISREFPKVCMEDNKGGEKRKISHMPMIGENKQKKFRSQNDFEFLWY